MVFLVMLECPLLLQLLTTTISQYGLDGAKYRSGSIMGLTQDDGDNTIDVIYSIKPDQGSVNTFNAMSTSITNINY